MDVFIPDLPNSSSQIKKVENKSARYPDQAEPDRLFRYLTVPSLFRHPHSFIWRQDHAHRWQEFLSFFSHSTNSSLKQDRRGTLSIMLVRKYLGGLL